MARLTDSGGLCYTCGRRPFTHDYSPPQGGVIGVCRACLPEDAIRSADGVYEMPHDPRHRDRLYDADEMVRLGDVVDALHLHDADPLGEHPAECILRLVARGSVVRVQA